MSGAIVVTFLFIFLSPAAVRSQTLSVPRHNLAAATTNNRIMFAGGAYGLPHTPRSYLGKGTGSVMPMMMYNILTGQWSSSPAIGSLSVSRSLLTGVGSGGKMVFAGGVTQAGDRSGTVDVYDTITGQWTTAPDLVPARSEAAATAQAGVVYVGGGRTATGASPAVDVNQVRKGTSFTRSSLTLSVARYSIAAASTGAYIVFAGGTLDGDISSATIDVINAKTGLLVGSYSDTVSREVCGIAAIGGKVYLAGGRDSFGGGVLPAIYRLTPPSGTSTALVSLEVPRTFTASAVVSSTMVFAGGEASGVPYDNVDAFTVQPSGQLSNASANLMLKYPRYALAGAGAGNVAVFAGGFNSGVRPEIDIFVFTAVCVGSPPSQNAMCVQGSWVIPITDTTISVPPDQPPIIIAPGDLSPTTTITIEISSNTTSAPLAVNGTLGVDGVLTIILNDTPQPGTYVVPIIDAMGISGNFSRIDVTSSGCVTVTPTTDIIGGTLVALLEVSDEGCDKSGRKLSAGAIAGISIGAVAAGALVVLAILLVVKKAKPGGALFNSYEKDSYVI